MNETKISPMLIPGKASGQPIGLGGIFILFIIGLCVDILMNTFVMIDILSYDLTKANLFILTIIFIFLTNEVVMSAFILYFVFRRNIIFRKLYLIQTCIFAVCYIFLFSVNMPIFSILMRILWTLYLFRSVQVKNTFIGIKSISETLSDTETTVY
jgi:hypothetical protein